MPFSESCFYPFSMHVHTNGHYCLLPTDLLFHSSPTSAFDLLLTSCPLIFFCIVHLGYLNFTHPNLVLDVIASSNPPKFILSPRYEIFFTVFTWSFYYSFRSSMFLWYPLHFQHLKSIASLLFTLLHLLYFLLGFDMHLFYIVVLAHHINMNVKLKLSSVALEEEEA